MFFDNFSNYIMHRFHFPTTLSFTFLPCSYPCFLTASLILHLHVGINIYYDILFVTSIICLAISNMGHINMSAIVVPWSKYNISQPFPLSSCCYIRFGLSFWVFPEVCFSITNVLFRAKHSAFIFTKHLEYSCVSVFITFTSKSSFSG